MYTTGPSTGAGAPHNRPVRERRPRFVESSAPHVGTMPSVLSSIQQAAPVRIGTRFIGCHVRIRTHWEILLQDSVISGIVYTVLGPSPFSA
jgi:hypothetical protein